MLRVNSSTITSSTQCLPFNYQSLLLTIAYFQTERAWVEPAFYGIIRDQRSHKEYILVRNILKFGVYLAYIERDTVIQKFRTQ